MTMSSFVTAVIVDVVFCRCHYVVLSWHDYNGLEWHHKIISICTAESPICKCLLESCEMKFTKVLFWYSSVLLFCMLHVIFLSFYSCQTHPEPGDLVTESPSRGAPNYTKFWTTQIFALNAADMYRCFSFSPTAVVVIGWILLIVTWAKRCVLKLPTLSLPITLTYVNWFS